MKITKEINRAIRHDLFKGIKFEKRPGKKNGPVIGLQLGPQFVFSWLVKEAWENFAASIPTASTCKFYSSEDLFSDAERWAALATTLHVAIGRCLAYFVNNEMLPLECVNPHESNKLYRVIDQTALVDTCRPGLPESSLTSRPANIPNQGVTDRSPSAIEI